jgi:hypothetical protein
MSAADSAPDLPDDDKAPGEPIPSQPKGHKTENPKPDSVSTGKSIPVVDKSSEEVDLVAEKLNASLKATEPELEGTAIEVLEDATDPLEDDLELESDAPISDELTNILEEKEPEDTPQEVLKVSEEAVTTEAETDALEQEIEIESEKLTEPSSDGLPDDEDTRAAVDDIIAEESDAVMAAEDLARDLENETVAVTKSGSTKFSWLKRLFSSKRGRLILFIVFFGSLLIAGLVPHSRYFVLNAAGVRSSLSLSVIDAGTRLPLKNVSVRVGSSSGQTDGEGKVRLDKVRLGRTILHIEKRAFAPVDKALTVGWGSNPLGEFEASAVGSQYTFIVKDFLSGKPIEGAEANSGEGDAVSDKDGKIVLTLDTAEQDDSEQITVDISSASYRTEAVSISVNNKESQSVDMVPEHKHVFVSKRSGKYDVYSIDVDGKNEKKIVEGTGIERDDITLVPHQSKDIAALVSTRERVLNTSGYLLSTLYVINTKDGSIVKIDQSEQIHLIGWSESGRLVYVKIAAGMSAADPQRHRLMSFNFDNFADVKELASSNSFNDVLMADGKIYYAPSNIFQDSPNPGMFVVNPDGSNQRMILNKEVYNIFHSEYDRLDISTGATWYSYELGSDGSAQSSQPPASQFTKVFADNPAKRTSLWVDTRDGKGVLLEYDKASKVDKTLVSRSGLKVPIYWLNDKYVVFRLNDGKETADFVLNTEGGEARKVTDVTDTNGVDRWYYY